MNEELNGLERAIVAMCKAFPKHVVLAIESASPDLTQNEVAEAMSLRGVIVSVNRKVIDLRKKQGSQSDIRRHLIHLKDNIQKFAELLDLMETK